MDDKQILTDVKWIALHRLRGITTTRLLPLLTASNSLDDFLRRVSQTACGLDASLVLSISHIAKADNPELSLLQSSLHDWQWLMANNGTVVDWFHRDYPALLREISDPPMLLYCLGNTS